MSISLMAVSACASDLSGIWTGVMADRNGDLQDFSFRLVQHDGSLSGKMYGDNESVPISEGRVNGDQITFIVTTELNGSISRTIFTGTVSNGEIRVTRGKADAPEKPNPKQSFSLKRL